MADHVCDCTETPPKAPARPCTDVATHRLRNEDGHAFLCRRHARALKDMYEPGQLRKLRTTSALSTKDSK